MKTVKKWAPAWRAILVWLFNDCWLVQPQIRMPNFSLWLIGRSIFKLVHDVTIDQTRLFGDKTWSRLQFSHLGFQFRQFLRISFELEIGHQVNLEFQVKLNSFVDVLQFDRSHFFEEPIFGQICWRDNGVRFVFLLVWSGQVQLNRFKGIVLSNL